MSRDPISVIALVRRAFYRYILPRLPDDLQAIVLDPPDLSRPASLVPVLKAIAPYTQFILVLVAMYIIWVFVAGVIGYLSRFLRFAIRIGPVIALIAWIMAASGQGGIDVLIEALKQYAGIETGGGGLQQQHPPARRSSFSGFFSADDRPNAGRARPRSGSTSSSGSSSYWERPNKAATRAKGGGRGVYDAAPDILSALLGGSSGDQQQPVNDGLQAVVQDYVKRAVARAAGLEWLIGTTAVDADEVKRPDKRRTKTR